MQINVELNRSRYGNINGTSTRHFRQYKIEGETDENTALTALLAENGVTVYPEETLETIPETINYGGVQLINRTIQSFDPLETKNCDKWKVVIAWDTGNGGQGGGLNALCEEEDFQFGIDITGEQQRIDWSREAIMYSWNGNSYPYPNGAVIIDCNDTVGANILVPKKRYTESACFPNNFVTKSWCYTAAASVGTTNAFTFRGCDPCEMLMTGIQGQKNGFGDDALWFLTFEWLISPNVVVDLPLWDKQAKTFITASAPLGGHDILLPYGCLKREVDIGVTVNDPLSWMVHRVHDKSDFAGNLGI